MDNGFWSKLKKPIIGLAPMDGVTDAPFRLLTAKYGKPDLHITEFTSAEGICAGAIRPLEAFIYDETERPIIAQLFGNTPECFYKAFFVIAELGFDGVDINMGCPSKNVATKGAGASLIQTPDLAKKLIRQSKKAAKDWNEGKKIEDLDLPEEIFEYVRKNKPKNIKRKLLPVSVKTRIGYNSNIAEEWIQQIVEEKPAAITLHGRTLKQMYTGTADWEAIAKAVEIAHRSDTLLLGNGDIKSLEDAHEHIKKYNVDGVLIGRAALGNPWIFNDAKTETLKNIFNTAIEHSRLHEKLLKKKPFVHMRKHLAWYCKGFHGASKVRQELMKTTDAKEVADLLNNLEMDLSSDSR